jgi:hypothetical protein
MVKVVLTMSPQDNPERVALRPSGPSKGIAAVSIRFDLRAFARTTTGLGLAGTALLMAGTASAQSLPPLSPAEVGTLPPEYRTGPMPVDRTETTIGADGIETITRTRYIPAPAAAQAAATPQAYMPPPHAGTYPGGPPMQPVPMGYAAQLAVFERQQWIDECHRRTAGRNRNDTGTIIGALLGAIGGGVAGNLIAGTGDKLLGTVIGGAAGGLGGGLVGSLFNGRKRDRYDCAAALDAYLSQPAPQRFASRSIPYPAAAYAYPVMVQQPAYTYYAPPPQEVVVPIRYEQPQQVIVRETVQEETVPGAARIIPAPPAPRPTKLIKMR